MYQAIGKADVQKRIREESPAGSTHCSILEKTPFGCINVHKQPEEERDSWAICPNNPYYFRTAKNKEGKLIQVPIPASWDGKKPIGESKEVSNHRKMQLMLIALSEEIHQLFRFSAKNELTSEEFTACGIISDRDQLQMLKAEGRVIAVEISKLLAATPGVG